jgi:hypothetical protein
MLVAELMMCEELARKVELRCWVSELSGHSSLLRAASSHLKSEQLGVMSGL